MEGYSVILSIRSYFGVLLQRSIEHFTFTNDIDFLYDFFPRKLSGKLTASTLHLTYSVFHSIQL